MSIERLRKIIRKSEKSSILVHYMQEALSLLDQIEGERQELVGSVEKVIWYWKEFEECKLDSHPKPNKEAYINAMQEIVAEFEQWLTDKERN